MPTDISRERLLIAENSIKLYKPNFNYDDEDEYDMAEKIEGKISRLCKPILKEKEKRFVTIQELLDILLMVQNFFVELGAEQLLVQVDPSCPFIISDNKYGSPSISISPGHLESEKECQQRIEKEELEVLRELERKEKAKLAKTKKEEKKREAEYKEYLQLKKKFGDSI